MAVKIQYRRDTAANWASTNPVLAQGEVGYETSTGRTKVGDGSSSWTVLGYSSLPASEIAATFATSGASQQYPMRRLSFQLAAQQTAAAQVKWLTYGSSVADIKIRNLGNPYLQNAYGGNTCGSIIGSYSDPTAGSASAVSTITTNSTTGTVTARTADFSVWPSGLTTAFQATGSRTYGMSGGAPTVDHIEIYYLTGPASSLDGGTFSYQVDSGSVTNVATSAVSQGIGRVALTPTLGAHTVTLAWVSGNVRIVGVGMWRTDISGIIWASVAQGGINLYDSTSQAFANFQTWLGWVTPDVVTFEMKANQISSAPSTPNLSSFTTWLNAVRDASVANAGPDVVIIGSTPDNQAQPELVVQDAIRTLVKTYQPSLNVFGWDGYRPLGSYANVLAMGWQGDGIHLSWQAQEFLGFLMARDLNLLGAPFAATSGNVLGSTITALTALKVGPKATSIAGSFTSDAGGNDVTLTVARAFKVLGPTANTLIDLQGSGGVTQIMSPFRVGTAGGYFVSSASTAISVSQDGGTTNYADINARSLTAALVGFGLKIREGSNARMGQSTLVAGTVVVANTSVTTNTRIFLTVATPGGTVGTPYVSALTNGTSFAITSTSGTDTSTVNWLLVEKI